MIGYSVDDEFGDRQKIFTNKDEAVKYAKGIDCYVYEGDLSEDGSDFIGYRYDIIYDPNEINHDYDDASNAFQDGYGEYEEETDDFDDFDDDYNNRDEEEDEDDYFQDDYNYDEDEDEDY